VTNPVFSIHRPQVSASTLLQSLRLRTLRIPTVAVDEAVVGASIAVAHEVAPCVPA